ncbi:uncharacterized protein HD556DRAFT_1467657 [Suillus plorans]|uniref:Uncharacterized protein n=1 Tax=Suillus plorans TaxID=116603 RepID=A0A9P7ATF0_9AGAM|nr:uncharacterized protein HD556DRAFT_1467657 [Suillus plorans]KAG1796274.1 hypothetical protein HD556DRAFT_1467657 [Suillus plorans]
MTLLYLVVRYVAIGFVVINTLSISPRMGSIYFSSRVAYSEHSNNFDDRYSRIIYQAMDWTGEVLELMLGVIMIARLHAMYQRSRKVLICLVVTFLATRIANAVMLAMQMIHISAEEFVLSGTYQCMISFAGDYIFLSSITWILGTLWEVLALCLVVWIAVKHFHELRQCSTRGITEDCFTVLMQTHVSYFASFFAIACFRIGSLSPMLSANKLSLAIQIYYGFALVFEMAQLSVLGPRLILGVREYHAKLVADSDAATAMTSIAFQEHDHVETSSSV